MESLEYGGEGGEQDSAGEEEGDLVGPGILVERGIDVVGEEGDGLGDRVVGGR